MMSQRGFAKNAVHLSAVKLSRLEAMAKRSSTLLDLWGVGVWRYKALPLFGVGQSCHFLTG